MVLKQTIGKGAKARHGLGKNLQGRQIVLSSTPKCNRHGIRYQLHDKGRNGRIQKENRRTRSYLAFPPLSWTFRSGGYINASLPRENEGVIAPFHAIIISVITKRRSWKCPPNCVSVPLRRWVRQLEHRGNPYCSQTVKVMQKWSYPSLEY